MMVGSFLHLLLAAFGLGVLIFIHELGHYWMARRQGMTVEVFSIGFGKPLFAWTYQGVKWQFCYLPFGGYVRIAGMEKKGSLEPHQIPNGFYGKPPLARIKVALMGPVVNILFAFLAFCVLWTLGGREKPFSEYTHLIGWVDPSSSIYHSGVRAGDEIAEVNGKKFRGFNDLLYALLLDPSVLKLQGEEVDYFLGQKTPFTYLWDSEGDGTERIAATIGAISPANYLLFHAEKDPFPAGSPMQESGVKGGDRLIWVDGELIFSKKELVSLINEGKALLTIERGNKTFLTRVPRLKISDLRLSPSQRGELDDWQHASSIKGKLADLYFVPYNLTAHGVVQSPLSYLNEDSQEQIFQVIDRSPLAIPLEVGDQILAVDGVPITTSAALFKNLQVHAVHLIVKSEATMPPISWKDADRFFVEGIEIDNLKKMVETIGLANPITEVGDLRLLKPVVPKPLADFPLPDAMRTRLAKELSSQKRAIEEIDNPEQRQAALHMLEENQKKLLLGVLFQDRLVTYNPSPFVLFTGVFDEIWKTMHALITGYLSPKWLSGPVGIVQVMQHNWMVGFKEALFWLGVISLNLGILNLLPIPVLDGGHICFSLWEAITKKPIKAKTMERLVFPFIVLLVLFFVYVTYHDLSRFLGRFWH